MLKFDHTPKKKKSLAVPDFITPTFTKNWNVSVKVADADHKTGMSRESFELSNNFDTST